MQLAAGLWPPPALLSLLSLLALLGQLMWVLTAICTLEAQHGQQADLRMQSLSSIIHSPSACKGATIRAGTSCTTEAWFLAISTTLEASLLHSVSRTGTAAQLGLHLLVRPVLITRTRGLCKAQLGLLERQDILLPLAMLSPVMLLGLMHLAMLTSRKTGGMLLASILHGAVAQVIGRPAVVAGPRARPCALLFACVPVHPSCARMLHQGLALS